MIQNQKEMKQEALNRLETLTKTCGLNPNVVRYFQEDRLYYSYLTCGGLIGSIDTISYDPRYEKAVRAFEAKSDCLVYHAIESKTALGDMLSLLYVSARPEQWEAERLCGNDILAYVVNLSDEDQSEPGCIRIQGFMSSGALVRLG